MHTPPRCSDALAELARRSFDAKGFWKYGGGYDELIAAVHAVPEPITIFADALEFMDREIERRHMDAREQELLTDLSASGPSPMLRDLLRAPLYDYQLRGAIFLACRGRCILGAPRKAYFRMLLAAS